MLTTTAGQSWFQGPWVHGGGGDSGGFSPEPWPWLSPNLQTQPVGWGTPGRQEEAGWPHFRGPTASVWLSLNQGSPHCPQGPEGTRSKRSGLPTPGGGSVASGCPGPSPRAGPARGAGAPAMTPAAARVPLAAPAALPPGGELTDVFAPAAKSPPNTPREFAGPLLPGFICVRRGWYAKILSSLF